MRKIKLFLCVALFGAIGYGAFSAYDYYTMSEEERFLLENIEALTEVETAGTLPGRWRTVGCGGLRMEDYATFCCPDYRWSNCPKKKGDCSVKPIYGCYDGPIDSNIIL